MQRLEVSGAVRPIYGSLGVKRLMTEKCKKSRAFNESRQNTILYASIFGGGNKLMTHQSMLRIWLCSARNETGDSMASRDLAQRRTTLSPVRWIFSVNWSTAILDGAQTRTEPPLCFTKWYTMVAEVTVFPVPGGPWINDNGRWTACFTAYTWKTKKHYMNLRYVNYMQL